MKIIFWGTPAFAAEILRVLTEDSEIDLQAVVTQPDRPRGRSATLIPSAVKEMAKERAPKVPIFQPSNPKDDHFVSEIASYEVDFFVVVAYGAILQRELLQIPKILPINVHASVLPKYRGAAPIQRAIMEGEQETGVTIMEMVSKMDAGDILATSTVCIEESSNFMDVHDSLLQIAPSLLLSVLKDWYVGRGCRQVQEESLVSYADKILPQDRKIDWDQPVQKVHNQIRALSPVPGAFSHISWGEGQQRQLTIWKSSVYSLMDKGLVGQVVTHPDLPWGVYCREGILQLLEVQLEGKRRMSVQNFLRGVAQPLNMQV